MRHLDNLKAGKDSGTGEYGVLVTQERMTDADAAKVDANTKADAPDGSRINTPNIDAKRGIGKPCTIVITLSQRVYLIYKALRDAQSDGEGKNTGKSDAKKEA